MTLREICTECTELSAADILRLETRAHVAEPGDLTLDGLDLPCSLLEIHFKSLSIFGIILYHHDDPMSIGNYQSP